MNTVLSTKGQIVLPAPARRALGLQPGDRLRVAVENGGVRLEPARRRAQLKMKISRRTGLPYIVARPGDPKPTLNDVKRILADFP